MPFEHGKILAATAGVELFVMPCGHNNCPLPWTAIEAFLQQHQLLPEHVEAP